MAVQSFSNSIPQDCALKNLTFWSRFKDVRVGEPCILSISMAEKLNPHMCRLADMT